MHPVGSKHLHNDRLPGRWDFASDLQLHDLASIPNKTPGEVERDVTIRHAPSRAPDPEPGLEKGSG